MIGLRFSNPVWLLLLPPLIWFAVRVARQSFSGLSPARAKLSLTLRLVIIVCLVGALAGPQAVTRVKQLCVMYVLDTSRSVPAESVSKALRWASDSQKEMRSGDSAGLIVFGRDAQIDFAPASGKLPKDYHSRPDGTATNAAAALRLAMASFPEQVSRHIVLMTDGNETDGDMLDQARIASAGGVRIDVVPLGAQKRDEAWVESLSIPTRLKLGEPFDARVVIGSSVAQTATLRLYRDGQPAGASAVHLNAGRSVMLLPQEADRVGSRHYRVEIDPKSDSTAENNKGYAYARVQGKPRLLFVTRDRQADRALVSALDAASISLDVIGPGQVPDSPAGFADVDGVVLSNVPATSFSAGQLLSIRGAVRQLGTGLAMIGGEDSFGAGGYFKTPVEEALPVKMTLRKERILPSMALVIIIDKSGSMAAMEGGTEKIRLANEAAIACIDAIQPNDRIGVIACDSDPKLVAPLREARERNALVADISSIRAGGGGIMVYSSLVRARDIMDGVDARVRHIILLADGSDAEEQKDSVALVREMATRKITVSAVAIGNGPDVGFLSEVAKAGKGGFYLTESARDLPKIFTKDTLLASRSLIVEEPFRPRVHPDMEPISGISVESMPPLLGYVGTTARSTAAQAMVSHKGDPVLATWQFGLGRSLAFTSDARAKWAAHWLDWPGYPSLWAQNARWIMRRSRPADWQAAVTVEGGLAKVRADAMDSAGNPIGGLDLVARAILPDGSTIEKPLEQTGTGRYETELPAGDAGDYVVNVAEAGRAGGAQDMAAASLAYPEEYRHDQTNTALLRQVAAVSGGRYSPEPGDLFRRTPRSERRHTDLWRYLTLAALLLLPVDIAVRRLVMSSSEAAELARKAIARAPRWRRRLKESPAPASVLLQAKRERAHQSVSDGPAPPLSPSAPSASPPSARAEEPAPRESALQPGPARSRLLDARRRRKGERDG